MEESEFSDYKKISIDFGKSSTIEIVFNDGRGTWDNNHGKNYTIEYNDLKAVTIVNGNQLKGEPIPVDEKKFVLYYKGDFLTPYAHYRPEGGKWTTAPGIKMEDSAFPGYKKIEVNLGSSNKIEVAFNDGKGNWDNRAGLNYYFDYNVTGAATFLHGKIKQGAP
jgi:alpha-amylase